MCLLVVLNVVQASGACVLDPATSINDGDEAFWQLISLLLHQVECTRQALMAWLNDTTLQHATTAHQFTASVLRIPPNLFLARHFWNWHFLTQKRLATLRLVLHCLVPYLEPWTALSHATSDVLWPASRISYSSATVHTRVIWGWRLPPSFQPRILSFNFQEIRLLMFGRLISGSGCFFCLWKLLVGGWFFAFCVTLSSLFVNVPSWESTFVWSGQLHVHVGALKS